MPLMVSQWLWPKAFRKEMKFSHLYLALSKTLTNVMSQFQVVQLTSVPDEIDERVGQAISVIGSNLPEMGRGVRQLASMMHDERQAGDLVEAARKLCGAFSDFLTTVSPEHEEKRTTVLAAAGRVGDFSQAVMNTMETQTEETRQFNEHLVQRAKHVATSTAQLVLKLV
jgi:talin